MRRWWLTNAAFGPAAALLNWRSAPAVAAPGYGVVRPGQPIAFPIDHGAHPAFRTEWWYITGWLQTDNGELGVQITFFRSRTGHDPANPSRFAPTQLLLAHVALARAEDGRLRHDQRSARLGFGDVRADLRDTGLAVGGWQLQRELDDRYRARIQAKDFGLALRFTPGSAPRLQGDAGYSRKGPDAAQASYYYSRPQLAVDGEVQLAGRRLAVRAGRAWLDHEWSSEILDPSAVGWDWLGLNLDDGMALMAFRIRSRDGGTVWSNARWLPAAGPAAGTTAGLAAETSEAPRFEVLRQWRSPRSGALYPVAMRVTIGSRRLELQPLFDDQELDARASTGAFYWEGAVRVSEAGRPVGRGYLELTGYAAALRL